jgi:hypothetical protein
MLGTPSLTAKDIVIGDRVQIFPMSPARGQRIDREALAEVHHGHHGPAAGLQDLTPAIPEVPPNRAAG